MLGTLEVAESPPLAAAVIRQCVPQKDLPGVMGPAIDELMAALRAQGVAPAGPVFNRYLSMGGGTFDFEVGVPVSVPISPSGRVMPGELPGAKVVRAVYRGPYTGLYQAWHEFGTAARAQGHEADGCFWESYVAGPETSADPASWQTELNQPLRG